MIWGYPYSWKHPHEVHHKGHGLIVENGENDPQKLKGQAVKLYAQKFHRTRTSLFDDDQSLRNHFASTFFYMN